MKKSWPYILSLVLAFTVLGVVSSSSAEAATCRVTATKSGNIISVRGYNACAGLRFSFKVNDAAASGGQGAVFIKVPTKYRTRVVVKYRTKTVYKNRVIYKTKYRTVYKTRIKTRTLYRDRFIKVPVSPPPPSDTPKTRQSSHNHDRLVPAPDFLSPRIDFGDDVLTAGEASLGLLSILLLVLLLLVGMHAGYYLGYKDSEAVDTAFMRALRDKIITRG